MTGSGLVRSLSGIKTLLSAHRIVELQEAFPVSSALLGCCIGGSGAAPGCSRYAARSQGRFRNFDFQKFPADTLHLLSPSVLWSMLQVKIALFGCCRGGSGPVSGCLRYTAWSRGRLRNFCFQKIPADRFNTGVVSLGAFPVRIGCVSGGNCRSYSSRAVTYV